MNFFVLSRTSSHSGSQIVIKFMYFLTLIESIVHSNESCASSISSCSMQNELLWFFFCSFDLWECDGHAVSPRHNYFKISDNKKRESDGNDLNIFPTSPVLKLLNYKVCTRRIVMLIAGHVYTSLYPV